MTLSVLLVGCGNMGRALLGGWLKKGIKGSSVCVVNQRLNGFEEFRSQGCQFFGSSSELPPKFRPDAVVLAVKPQVIASVANDYRHFVGAGSTFVSIAAGTKLSVLEKVLGSDAPIIRAMPNTPAAISRGVTVSVANNKVSGIQRKNGEELLAAVGSTAWVEDENLMDAVTGVSGSGPAYVFFLIEAMTAAGVKAGLPEELACQLAKETVAGAGELARTQNVCVSELRTNVTSPNGTTAAGLEQLMDPDHGLGPLMEKTVEAATNRSKELAK